MANVFDYVKSINDGKRIELGTDYNQYLINEIFSYYPECLLIIQAIQGKKISDEMHYNYLLSTIRPRKRQFIKLKRRKRTHTDVLLISEIYKYSLEKAKDALSVMTDDQLQALKEQRGIEA